MYLAYWVLYCKKLLMLRWRKCACASVRWFWELWIPQAKTNIVCSHFGGGVTVFLSVWNNRFVCRLKLSLLIGLSGTPCCARKYSQSLSSQKCGLSPLAQIYTHCICRNSCNFKCRLGQWQCSGSTISDTPLGVCIFSSTNLKNQAAWFGLILDWKMTQSQVWWDFVLFYF